MIVEILLLKTPIKFCLINNIVSTHLKYVIDKQPHFYCESSQRVAKQKNNIFINRLLKIETNDAYRIIHNCKLRSCHLYGILYQSLPFEMWQFKKNFFKKHQKTLTCFAITTDKITIKRIKHLETTHYETITKNIKYSTDCLQDWDKT